MYIHSISLQSLHCSTIRVSPLGLCKDSCDDAPSKSLRNQATWPASSFWLVAALLHLALELLHLSISILLNLVTQHVPNQPPPNMCPNQHVPNMRLLHSGGSGPKRPWDRCLQALLIPCLQPTASLSNLGVRHQPHLHRHLR